jgi:hypothetical protein
MIQEDASLVRLMISPQHLIAIATEGKSIVYYANTIYFCSHQLRTILFHQVSVHIGLIQPEPVSQRMQNVEVSLELRIPFNSTGFGNLICG